MKKNKFVALLLALAMCIGMLSGCGQFGFGKETGYTTEDSASGENTFGGFLAGTGDENDNGNDNGGLLEGLLDGLSLGGELSGEVTLKEFLDSGPKVGFTTGSFPLDKDSSPVDMYLFEDGKMYYIYSFDAYDKKTDDYRLTWGEIAQMSDEELLEHAHTYMTLHNDVNSEGYRFEFDPDDPNVDWDTVEDDLQNPGDVLVYYSSDNYFHTELYEDTMYAVVYVSWYAINSSRDEWPSYDHWDGRDFYADEAGNLYFIPDDSWGYPVGYDKAGDYEEFSELTPYDGRYGEIKLPALTFTYNYGNEMPTGEYTLHLYTDSSGNYVDKECIEVMRATYGNEAKMYQPICLYNTYPGTGTVYNSNFTVLYDEADRDHGLIFRTNDDLTITLDNIGDAGVEVD